LDIYIAIIVGHSLKGNNIVNLDVIKNFEAYFEKVGNRIMGWSLMKMKCIIGIIKVFKKKY